MNNYKSIFICQACKVDFIYASNLNKHLNTCDKYEEWYKMYSPPSIKKCEKCNNTIIEKYYLNHKNNCSYS